MQVIDALLVSTSSSLSKCVSISFILSFNRSIASFPWAIKGVAFTTQSYEPKSSSSLASWLLESSSPEQLPSLSPTIPSLLNYSRETLMPSSLPITNTKVDAYEYEEWASTLSKFSILHFWMTTLVAVKTYANYID